MPAVVADGNGYPISNLGKADFVVKEDGVEQQIAIFEEFIAPAKSRPFAPIHDANPMVTRSSAQDAHVTIIVLDLMSKWANVAYARQKLVKFLASISELEPTALLVYDRYGFRVIHDFADDPSVLIAALKNVEGPAAAPDTRTTEPGPSPCPGVCGSNIPGHEQRVTEEANALEQLRSGNFVPQFVAERNQRNIREAYREIAQEVAGMPGQKSLIWIGDVFPPSFRTQLGTSGVDLKRTAEWRATWQALSDARVSIYPISAEGLVSPTGGGEAQWNSRLGAYGNLTDIAAETGGKAFFATTSLVIIERAETLNSAGTRFPYAFEPTGTTSGAAAGSSRPLTRKTHPRRSIRT